VAFSLKLYARLPRKWRLSAKVVPFVVAILLAKLAVHLAGFEFLPLSNLFTALITANIFLLGFLLSGVLSDYKESEKLPSDIATSLETMSDEGVIIYRNKHDQAALAYLIDLEAVAASILDWFQKNERTSVLMDHLAGFNDHFLKFESLTQANFIVRLKQEQSAIRRTINRIHTIRETSFNESGYAIVEAITAILSIGMVFLKLDPFFTSFFFVSFVSFVLIYMVMLIRDLDNPFGYYENESLSEEVSIKPIRDVQQRLHAINRSFK
jgi:predicted membrane chloride channel (bestrophin family)